VLFFRDVPGNSTDKVMCKVCFSFFIKTSIHSLQSFMNDRLNHLGMYADLREVRSIVTLHSLRKTKQIISGWLTLNMKTSCFSETSVSLITKQLTLYKNKKNSDAVQDQMLIALSNKQHETNGYLFAGTVKMVTV